MNTTKSPNPFDAIEERLVSLTQAIDTLTEHLYNDSNNVNKPLSLNETIHYLDVSKATLYLLTSKREIPHLKRGQKLYFLKADLDQWLLSHRIEKGTTKEVSQNTEGGN